MITKICTKCGVEKDIIKFSWRNDNQTYRNECKECKKLYNISYIEKNRDRLLEKGRNYYWNNRENILTKNLNYRISHRETAKLRRKIWYKNNTEQAKKVINAWRDRNPDKVKEYNKKSWLKVQNRINSNFTRSINRALVEGKEGISWRKLLSYTLEDLINHLEFQFQEGMTWANYGIRGWHIDHIIPISWWSFESYEDREFKQCWSLANLQPLWASDNISKLNRYAG